MHCPLRPASFRLLTPLLFAALALAGCDGPPWTPDDVIDYKKGLSLYLFRPVEAPVPTGWPVVLFFHGGGWQYGTAEQFFPQCAELSKLGYLCISAAYRVRSRDGTGMEEAVADAREAFTFLLAHARSLRADPERIVLGGGSAGGHLALATAMAARDNGTPARGLLLFNPVVDLSPGTPDHVPAGSAWQAYSPLHQLAPGLPPMLILQGSEDREVDPATAARYCERVRETGTGCQIAWYPGERHGFFNYSRSRYRFFDTLWETLGFLDAIGVGGDIGAPRRLLRLIAPRSV